MKKLVQLVGILILSVSFGGCLLSTQILEHTSEPRGAIPPYFGQDTNAILLCVLENSNSYDRYLKKHVKAQYHGKYEFLQKEQVDQPPYNDIVKYRYIFSVTRNFFSTRVYDASAKKNVTEYSASYYHYVLDRKIDKKYNIAYADAAFGLQIKSYMINLEKKRLSFIH